MLDEQRERPARNASRTQQQILRVARASFARRGYDGTTVRTVAAEAGVSANLITRYFGGKAGLYRAATAVELDLATVLPGGLGSLGRRVAHKVVERWESATPDDPLLMMLRSAGTSDEAARALRRFLEEVALRPTASFLARELDCDPAVAMDRVAGLGALICGVVMMRYVMCTGPLASTSPASLEAWLGERLQRMLDDPPPPQLGVAGALASPRALDRRG
jgi:AcrR family transcriptional regulator